MKEAFIVIMTAVLTNNYILVKFMGICPFLGASNKNKSALYMSLTTGIVMVLSTACTWAVWNKILLPLEVEYLRTLVFILIIAGVVGILEIICKISFGKVAETLGIYLPLIAGNCAVLGLCVTNVTQNYSFLTSIENAIGAGLGFMLAMFMFSGVRERIEHSNIPESFKGAPITLIAAAIVSLSFIGFTGLGVGLFGM